jgi:hypothetical protein
MRTLENFSPHSTIQTRTGNKNRTVSWLRHSTRSFSATALRAYENGSHSKIVNFTAI